MQWNESYFDCSVDPVLERADQVAEMKFSGRAHPRQHTLLGHGIRSKYPADANRDRPEQRSSGRRSASKHTE